MLAFYLPRLRFIKLTELFLGMGLGLGYMTSLRFLGPVGISEIFFLITLVLLFRNHGRSLFRYELNSPGLIKLYMLLATCILLPLMTILTALFTEYRVSPEYVISYIMGVSLAFLIVEALRSKRIYMPDVVLWFAFSYILTNFITIFISPSALEFERYSGAANNPNQLMFYASCLSLLLVIYRPKLSFVLVPIIAWITLKSGSDAYALTIAVVIIVYLLLFLMFNSRLSFGASLLISILISLLIIYFIVVNYFDDIVLIWITADEGGARVTLMLNALSVSLGSPLLGYGAGSFSWFNDLVNAEAHNTFLDFSMQFGFIFPSIIYFVFFAFLFSRIKLGYHMQAAFVASFIVSGLFHFTGRHFFFWVEFAIFYYYVFHDSRKLVLKSA